MVLHGFSPGFLPCFPRFLRTLGPDHLAALAPLVIGKRRSVFAAFGLGALWGSGHATGQLVPWGKGMGMDGDGEGEVIQELCFGDDKPLIIGGKSSW